MIKLSVIIPTRDRAALLARNLDSIINQNYPRDDFEVIIIDNGSKDSTAEVCKSYSDKFINFRYLYDERPGLHVGRHLGMKNAAADILVYADDDIRAFPTWLEGVAESFRDEKTVLVGGKCLPEFETQPPKWLEYLWEKNEYGKFIGHHSVLDFGDEIKDISPHYVWGSNFSIRKQTLIEAKGFHPDKMPDGLIRLRGDGETAVSDFIQAQKYKTVYNPKASVYHLVSAERMSLEYLYERNFAQGVSNSYSDIRKNKGVTKRLINKYFEECKVKFKKIIKSMLFAYKYNEIDRVIEKGNFDGYYFHQAEAVRDKRLIEWILKQDYFND
jgi:glycosyltransferase involved in cell wall biosynthesis